MISTLVILQTSVFVALSGIHFNWALGGTFGLEKSIPLKEDGTRLINPGKVDSAIVGTGLLVFASYYPMQAGWWALDLPGWLQDVAGWVISAIFVLRAMGDFRYVGFFKRVRSSDFAANDTRYYSPLCLGIGMLGVILNLWLD